MSIADTGIRKISIRIYISAHLCSIVDTDAKQGQRRSESMKLITSGFLVAYDNICECFCLASKLYVSPAMLCCVIRACLRCPRIARRCFASQSRHIEEQCSEKDFRPKKALLVRKVTRYEYEKFYLKPELDEAQLQEYVRNLSSVMSHFVVRRNIGVSRQFLSRSRSCLKSHLTRPVQDGEGLLKGLWTTR